KKGEVDDFEYKVALWAKNSVDFVEHRYWIEYELENRNRGDGIKLTVLKRQTFVQVPENKSYVRRAGSPNSLAGCFNLDIGDFHTDDPIEIGCATSCKRPVPASEVEQLPTLRDEAKRRLGPMKLESAQRSVQALERIRLAQGGRSRVE